MLAALLICAVTALTCALPDGVELIGRFSQTEKGYAADWPGSLVRMRVAVTETHPTITVTFGDDANLNKYFIGTFVDCKEDAKFEINRNQLVLSFSPAALTQGGVHEISFMRITEASNGDSNGFTIFNDVQITGGHILTAASSAQIAPTGLACAHHKRLLFVGDSYTAAYGVDGTPPCGYSAETEDVRHSYAQLVSSQVSADMQVIAWSGRGVVRNYGDVNPTSDMPMPAYYNRTLATVDSYYNPSNYRPDVAIVMLGTNDYSTAPQPSDEQFTSGLVALALQIQGDYKCPVLLMCAPGSGSVQCTNTANAAKQTGSTFLHISDNAFDGGKGCDGHPNQQTEANIAAQVTPVVKTLLAGGK